MTHLLVTNDFPPKVGGIQSYLWELWRRLPPGEAVILTTPYAGDTDWDDDQPFRVVRTSERVLWPTRALARRIDALAAEVGADLVLLDPALPLGLVGRHLACPYGVVVHGAEVTVPGRLPVARQLLARVLRGATVVIAAGGYPRAEAERAAGRPLPTVLVPPGVDPDRFRPLPPAARREARAHLGLPTDAPLVVSASRLVPRKGMDVLIRACDQVARTSPGLVLAIAGSGRDRPRLERVARRVQVPVSFLGRLPDADLAALVACADVFAMLCRNRWLGLEQEGFGIVFLEAAASGVPQVAGRSGGAHEAVVHERTGLVVDEPRSVAAVATALASLIGDPDRGAQLGAAARVRVEDDFAYPILARRLVDGLAEVGRR